jgi:hypothetical protein
MDPSRSQAAVLQQQSSVFDTLDFGQFLLSQVGLTTDPLGDTDFSGHVSES